MTFQQIDTIIIGQGLAGTSLAWQLLKHGKKVLVIDAEDSVTSSKIAAGLVTPITGKRLVISWRFQQLLQHASGFYQRIEKETDSRFFHQRGMIRLFSSQEEKDLFQEKRAIPSFSALVQSQIVQPQISNVDETLFSAEFSGFEMPVAFQLNTALYLEKSRQAFLQKKCYRNTHINMTQDIVMTDRGVQIPKSNIEAKRLIFCRGAEDRHNLWFSQLLFKPAQGEILTLKIPALKERRIFNRQTWLAPKSGHYFAAGSTYQWDQFDCLPSEQGKETIVSGLKKFVRCDFEIVDHQAAIRPALHDQKPVIGMHRQFRQLGIMNGLGSKGSLQSPWLADHFAKHLCNNEPIDSEVDLNKRFPV